MFHPQDCETCGQAAAGGGTRGRKAAAAAADLAYCSVCGGLAHEGCMQVCWGGSGLHRWLGGGRASEGRVSHWTPADAPLPPVNAALQAQGDGALKCTLCLAGLADVEAVLGCRLARGADKGDERREYFVKFKEKSYRWERLLLCFLCLSAVCWRARVLKIQEERATGGNKWLFPNCPPRVFVLTTTGREQCAERREERCMCGSAPATPHALIRTPACTPGPPAHLRTCSHCCT